MGRMSALPGTIVGLVLILLVLSDSFETLVSPRRVTRRLRPTSIFYRLAWPPWFFVGKKIASHKRREAILSIFGPLSILVLFIVWALGLMVGFAVLQWSNHVPLHLTDSGPSLFMYFYLSGITLFTVGYGDVTPDSTIGRVFAVGEAGLGLGFLALVITYLPILYQAYSNRESTITKLDARAGSPPSAGQVLMRLSSASRLDRLDPFLREWENWASELLESHLSYPVLAYYRSQHDNESWVAALTATLDTCALVMSGLRDISPYQAQMTFAMARHAAVDLALIFSTEPRPPAKDRLPPDRFEHLKQSLARQNLCFDHAAADRLAQFRSQYEPFVNAMSLHFLMDLPPFISEQHKSDNWQTTAWKSSEEHFG
jgi:hypothetical protein